MTHPSLLDESSRRKSSVSAFAVISLSLALALGRPRATIMSAGFTKQFDTPEDMKKQNSTPVRRGRQPEMSGQLGGSLMSLKCQSNLLNCTSVGAFANVPS